MTPPQRKRMDGFDYSLPGCDFVTVVLHGCAPSLGSIHDGQVTPSAVGLMVRETWDGMPSRFPGTNMNALVVMPDHTHGIVMLGTDPRVESTSTLSSVMGTFKSVTSIRYGRGVREEGWPPYVNQFWQRSFRDTIIRSDRALNEFRAYIEGNPGRWAEAHCPS